MLSQHGNLALTVTPTEISPVFDISSIGLYTDAPVLLAEYTEAGWGTNQSITANVPFYKETAAQKIRISAVSGTANINYSLIGFKAFRVGGETVEDILDVFQTLINKTATYTVLPLDFTINCTANSFTVTLLSAVGNQGKVYNIKNSGLGLITVDTTSSQTIDGLLTQTIPPDSGMCVQSDGTNWVIV
jgi:hypothetical protein